MKTSLTRITVGATWLASVWSCSGVQPLALHPDSGGTAGTSSGGSAGTTSGGTAGTSSGGTAGTSSGGTAGSTRGGTGGVSGGGVGGSQVACEFASAIATNSVIVSKPCVGPQKKCDAPTNDPCTKFLACAENVCQTTLISGAQCRTNEVEPCNASGSPGVMICSTAAPPDATACKWQGACQACGNKNQPCCSGSVHCSESGTFCRPQTGALAATGVCSN